MILDLQNYSSHTKLRNSDGCSVVCSELIAIDTGLKEALSIPGVAILEKLKRLSYSREIHLQWVPSHANIAGNDIADSLALDGTAQPIINSAPLTYSELHSIYINNKQSTVPPVHHWYEPKRPGVVLFPFNAAGRNKLF
ncbi:RNase H domain-containing protein [Trichonephila clavipes]|nr:RNase H domain-containing protein [Trichonephila clavipes]